MDENISTVDAEADTSRVFPGFQSSMDIATFSNYILSPTGESLHCTPLLSNAKYDPLGSSVISRLAMSLWLTPIDPPSPQATCSEYHEVGVTL